MELKNESIRNELPTDSQDAEGRLEISELQELQLTLVGGGIGDTVL